MGIHSNHTKHAVNTAQRDKEILDCIKNSICGVTIDEISAQTGAGNAYFRLLQLEDRYVFKKINAPCKIGKAPHRWVYIGRKEFMPI